MGRLWLEATGPDSDRNPVVAFPSHSSFSHDILHDLLDPFQEYFRVGYVELPGTRRNPAPADRMLANPAAAEPLRAVEDSLGALLAELRATRIHLLGHLASCSLVLEVACRHAGSVASLILLDPDLSFRERLGDLAATGRLRQLADGDLAGIRRRELAATLIEALWLEGEGRQDQHELEPFHRQGLAAILAAGMSPQQLRRELSARAKDGPLRPTCPAEAPGGGVLRPRLPGLAPGGCPLPPQLHRIGGAGAPRAGGRLVGLDG